MTRRDWIAGGAGAALFATLGNPLAAKSWLGRLISRFGAEEVSADIFRGDAPDEGTWRAWTRRGWVKEARHYLRLDGNTQCKVCPNNCLLTPGDRSHCRNKVNRGGTLYTLAYANPCAIHLDPVEKKPLYHYLPGSRTFSLATSGCVFRCLNCQNWEISQKKPEETKDPDGPELRLRTPPQSGLGPDELRRLSLFPEDVPGLATALGCRSVSYTYSEPTAFFEYAQDCSREVRAAGLANILVTCGSIEERPFRDLATCIDAAHVDLKGFTSESYRELNSGKLEPVLATLKRYRELGIWVEVINLIVPTYTDRLDDIRRLCDWLARELGPDTPLHFSRFHPEHRLEYLRPTPLDILVDARAAARDAGLRYVYLGNVREVADAGTTHCPGCRAAVVERDGFAVSRMDLVDGRCRQCGTRIAGVWDRA